MSDVLALITARGGSKGILRKNIRLMAGKPLIVWTIEAAQHANTLTRVVLSTDDIEIADLGRQSGIEVPFMRPDELATDSAGHFEVVMQALDWLRDNEKFEPDYVLTLQPTSPLRTAEDIDTAVILAEEKQARAVVSVTETFRHPYLTLQMSSNGDLIPFLDPQMLKLRRQEYPDVYSINGAIYLNRPVVLFEEKTFFPEQGTYPYIMPPERSIDVDTMWDFHLAELILKDRLSYESD